MASAAPLDTVREKIKKDLPAILLSAAVGGAIAGLSNYGLTSVIASDEASVKESGQFSLTAFGAFLAIQTGNSIAAALRANKIKLSDYVEAKNFVRLIVADLFELAGKIVPAFLMAEAFKAILGQTRE